MGCQILTIGAAGRAPVGLIFHCLPPHCLEAAEGDYQKLSLVPSLSFPVTNTSQLCIPLHQHTSLITCTSKLETASGSKGLSEQQKLNSEMKSRFFPPVSAELGSYPANVLLASLSDSAASQILEEIHAPRSNTKLTLEGQGHPGMLQKCSSQPHCVPVATLSNTNMEPTNRNPSPAPLPASCTAEGLCAPRTGGPLATSFFLDFFPLIAPKGLPFTLLYLFYLKY